MSTFLVKQFLPATSDLPLFWSLTPLISGSAALPFTAPSLARVVWKLILRSGPARVSDNVISTWSPYRSSDRFLPPSIPWRIYCVHDSSHASAVGRRILRTSNRLHRPAGICIYGYILLTEPTNHVDLLKLFSPTQMIRLITNAVPICR